MKNLIVFSTLTGNTEKIANAIFSEIKGDKEIFNVKETQNIDVNDYDKIIIGYWVDRGDADEVSKIFMSKIKNKTIGTFGTLGSDPFSEHARSFVEKVIRFFENN